VKKLLVVEDRPEIRELIRMTLEFEPYEVHMAGDGVSGLEAARRLRPDLMLLDVMMPGELDGLAVCRAVRADPALAGTRVVMLSAKGQQGDTAAGLAAGADLYLIKPFSPIELLQKVEQLA
jgi:two-component system, OmpR family, phosphate regulon response regulator PhoB